MAMSTNPAIPAPGGEGPWVTQDCPAGAGDYTLCVLATPRESEWPFRPIIRRTCWIDCWFLTANFTRRRDYNFPAAFYGIYGSNHPAQAASYFGAIRKWEAHAAQLARLIARRLNLTSPLCNASLHYPDHISTWGYQSIDQHIYMHWNGDFASLLFLNDWEYTRNKTFARQSVWPLVSGLVNWLSCFLHRSIGADGSPVLEDWNPRYEDEEHECMPRRNPMIGLAFARRLAAFQIALAIDLGLPEPTGAVQIQRYLIGFPTNCTGISTGEEGNCSWVAYGNATVETSDDFALYPVFPTEYLSQGSDEKLLRIARRTLKTYVRQHHTQ
jgi:hypothetical protein